MQIYMTARTIKGYKVDSITTVYLNEFKLFFKLPQPSVYGTHLQSGAWYQAYIHPFSPFILTILKVDDCLICPPTDFGLILLLSHYIISSNHLFLGFPNMSASSNGSIETPSRTSRVIHAFHMSNVYTISVCFLQSLPLTACLQLLSNSSVYYPISSSHSLDQP